MRANSGSATRTRRKKILKLAKGYRGQRHINFKVAQQQVWKSYLYAYRDRKNKKRDFRKLWIARINAAARINGLSYSKFMHGLVLANAGLNRKMLADIAVSDPEMFAQLAETAKNALNGDFKARNAATLETKVVVERIEKGEAKAIVLTPDPSKKGQKQKQEKVAKPAKAKPATKAQADKDADLKSTAKLSTAEVKAVEKPTDKSTVGQIKQYLDDQNIKYAASDKKADLLKLVK